MSEKDRLLESAKNFLPSTSNEQHPHNNDSIQPKASTSSSFHQQQENIDNQQPTIPISKQDESKTILSEKQHMPMAPSTPQESVSSSLQEMCDREVRQLTSSSYQNQFQTTLQPPSHKPIRHSNYNSIASSINNISLSSPTTTQHEPVHHLVDEDEDHQLHNQSNSNENSLTQVHVVHNIQHLQPPRHVVLYPGFEYDPMRSYIHMRLALTSSVLIFITLVMVGSRDCVWEHPENFSLLQALNVSLLLMTFVLYILTLFGLSEMSSTSKTCFYCVAAYGLFLICMLILMAVTSAKSLCYPPIDDYTYRNVFDQGDAIGIIIVIINVAALISMTSATFYILKNA